MRPRRHRSGDPAWAGWGLRATVPVSAVGIGAACGVVVLSALGVGAPAERDSVGAAPHPVVSSSPVAQDPHDGEFTFTRIRYGEGLGRRGRGRMGGAWRHDYPDADLNLQTILAELTALNVTTGRSNVFELEDPEIFRNPILYISEPGFWSISSNGARNLRDYLLKGGFLIFDDFEGRQWDNMAAQMARTLPDARWIEIDGAHPIFQSFFSVEDIYVPHPLVRVTPAYYAIFEEDDPTRRIMVLANHNSDLAEYWEWSPTGFFAVDPTNDAYRLGVNYIIYAFTH